MRVVLLDDGSLGGFDREEQAALGAGGQLETSTYERFRSAPRPADIVLNAGGWSFHGDSLGCLEGCRCIVGYGVGVDWIDVKEASAKGILVVNSPRANVEEVATHALALILACARRLVEHDRDMRDGGFDWTLARPLHRLRGRTLGLLAFGAIPRLVAPAARALGLRVVAHDPFVDAAAMREADVAHADLDALLRRADILSVHVPATAESRGLLSEERLSLLPPGAIVVITSRGQVYDAEALMRALAGGRIAAAGLDVFPEEPLPPDHGLRRLPNVVMTPHVAWYSEEAIHDLHEAGAAAIAAFARGEAPTGALNPAVLRAQP